RGTDRRPGAGRGREGGGGGKRRHGRAGTSPAWGLACRLPLAGGERRARPAAGTEYAARAEKARPVEIAASGLGTTGARGASDASSAGSEQTTGAGSVKEP